MAKLINFFLRLSLAGACLVYVFWNIDYSILIQTISTMAPEGLAIVFVMIVMNFLAMGSRIRFIAKGNVSYRSSFNAAVIGLGVNNILPAKAGEIAKALYLKKESNLSLGHTLGFVFWERFSDFNILVLCALFSAAINKVGNIIWPVTLSIFLFWCGLFVLWYIPDFGSRLVSIIPYAPLKNFVQTLIRQLKDNMSISFFIQLAFFSLVVWVLYFLQYFFLLKQAAELDLNAFQIFTVFIIAAGGMALPTTPGAVGVYEAFMVAGLGFFGIEKEMALAIGLVYHVLLFGPSTIYAILILIQKGLTLKEVKSQAV